MDIRLQTRDRINRREFFENDHKVHALQGGQDLDPLRGRYQGSSRSFELAHRGIAVDSHHQNITMTSGSLQITDMADVEQIEAAVSPHDGLFFLPRLGTPFQERIPGCRFAVVGGKGAGPFFA
jgi:hypothetical protein